MIGSSLGPYQVLAKLGAGGMGEVYRARDTKLDRDVAVKTLPPEFAKDSERVARFRREAKTLASINHPHIAQVYGLEEASDGTLALVMEIVEGEDLAQRLKRGAIPVDEALPLATQIAEALEAAHEQGIVHRDLKPANIKVRDDGTVKVLDFGLAKAIEPGAGSREPGADQPNWPTITSPAMTQAGIILGTAAYMAPEQAKGKFVDKRADIWAFGCVLFEMLTAQRPFPGDDVTDTIVAVMSREPDFSALPGGTPTAVCRLLARCLKKDVKARLRDIGDARQDIEAVIGGDREVAEPARASRSRVLPWAIGTAATTSAALLVVLALGTPWRVEEPASRPLIRLDVDLGDGASLFVPGSGGGSKGIAISPDGLRIAYVSGTPSKIFVRRLDQQSSTELAGTEGATDVFFSADGQWLGFSTGRNKVSKVSVDGGAVVPVIDVTAYRGAFWSEDGSLFVGASPNVVRIPPTGGPPETIAEARQGELFIGAPHVLPGGKAVLVIVDHAGGVDRTDIEVVTIADRQRRIVVRGAASPRYVPASQHLVYTTGSTLFAVPFDLAALDVSGSAVPIINDLAADRTTGTAKFDISASGTLIYRKDRGNVASPMTLQWFGPGGPSNGWKLRSGQYLEIRLSPNGTQAALIVNDGRGNDLWLYDSGRDLLSPITSHGRGVVSPVWSPDGRYIVYSVIATGIFQVRVDGSTPSQVLLQSTANQRPTSFSPDGKRIAYWESAGDGEIWTVAVEDDGRQLKAGKPEPFLSDPVANRMPSFSPDGRWLAYQSRESGPIDEVFVRPFPVPASGAGGRWQISIGGGTVPRWSPTGDMLLYQANDRIVAVPYSAKGDAFIPEKPRPWSGGSVLPTLDFSWDLSADGKRVGALAPEQSAETAKPERVVVFLQNFFDELRRRAPLPR